MEIAVLAWGSLLWDTASERGQAFERMLRDGGWKADGPTLKLEFSRISESRGDALTLVIDEAHGTETTVRWRLSRRTELYEAVCDLRCREGCKTTDIGSLLVANGEDQEPNWKAMRNWARDRHLGAVIWTALPSNFKAKKGTPFSVQAAIDHLQALLAENKAKAFEYVARAPGFVDTPLRQALQREPWFASGSI